jgi:hypothetical protein
MMRCNALVCAVLAVLAVLCQGCTCLKSGSPDISLQRVYTVYEVKVPNSTMIAFSGSVGVPIHRPSPEHFNLQKINGSNTRVGIAFPDSDPPQCYHTRDVDWEPDMMRGELGLMHAYNYTFRGVVLFIHTERNYVLFGSGSRVATLYCQADLEADQRYKLTWACWPIGSKHAIEKSVEFCWDENGNAQQSPGGDDLKAAPQD